MKSSTRKAETGKAEKKVAHRRKAARVRASIDPRLHGLDPFRKLKRASAREVRALLKKYPEVPADYVEFIRTIGWAASAGRSSFALYGGLLHPASIFDSGTVAEMKAGHILLFGDDFSGTCYGFDPRRRWRIVSVDPTAGVWREASSFSEFILAWAQNMGWLPGAPTPDHDSQ
jgi:hypothetical protein